MLEIQEKRKHSNSDIIIIKFVKFFVFEWFKIKINMNLNLTTARAQTWINITNIIYALIVLFNLCVRAFLGKFTSLLN